MAGPQINAFIRNEALHRQNARENETFILRYANEMRVRAFITRAAGTLAPRQLGRGWDIPMTVIHIAYVGACESVRGGGWGKHLIDRTIEHAAQAQGVRAINLFAYPDMTAYYEKNFGFVKHGSPRQEDTDPEPKQMMIYDILAAIRESAGQPVEKLARIPVEMPLQVPNPRHPVEKSASSRQ